jgi:single-stranded-DNA-specific exonuclease
MIKRWVKKEYDVDAAQKLNEELKIHPILTALLIQRKIYNYEEAKHFFRPSLNHLHDPFLMKDMDKAIDRIKSAMLNKEKILIYGDYDVDGTTAVSLVYSFITKHYLEVDYYIPNRYREGYGISNEGIDWAAKHNFTLIIALDCGIKSIDKIDYATSLGIDFIICDHHTPGDEIPKALAVLDPKRSDCEYPFKELCGCGVGFKLVQAYAQVSDIPFEELHQYLDLAAISIASDIVPIYDENRVLAYFGMKRINEQPRAGIKALLDMSAVKKELSISDLVFVIGPRINAAGRMDDAKNAVRLLLSDTPLLATNNADILNQKNTERRKFDSDITKEAISILANEPEQFKKKSTVLYRPHWHKGVIGIVASRLLDVHYRPTIILTLSNGHAAGSARSVVGFDIYNAIKECADLLEQYGGHMYAAGLTIKEENIDAFIEKFETVVKATIDEKLLTPEIVIDAELDLSDITKSFNNILQQFAPFGPDNMKPVFISKNLKDTGYSKITGTDHLKVSLRDTKGNIVNGIAFGMGNYYNLVKQQHVDICYTLEENEFNGQKKIDLIIKDIKISNLN